MTKIVSLLRNASVLALLSMWVVCLRADIKSTEELPTPSPLKNSLDARGSKAKENSTVESEISRYSDQIEKNPQDAFSYALRAGVYASIGRDSEAIADFTAALNLGPDPKIASAIYNDRASILQRTQNIEMALKDYESAIKLDPQNKAAFLNRGILYSRKGDLPEAVGNFTLAVLLDPQNFEAFRNRALARYRLEDVKGGVGDALEAIRLGPTESVCYLTHGYILLQEREFKLAIQVLTKAIELNSSQTSALLTRADAYLRNGNLDGMRDDVITVLKLTPESYQAANHLANYYFLIGNYSEALVSYRKLISVRPPSTQATYNRIEAYLLSLRLHAAVPTSKAFLDSVAATTGWAQTVCRYVCGNLSEKDFFEQALSDQADRKSKRLAEAYFYAGEIGIISGNGEAAELKFKKCIEYDQVSLIEHHFALAELKRLTDAPALRTPKKDLGSVHR